MKPSAVRLSLLLSVVVASPLLAQESAPKHLLRMAFETGKVTWYRQTTTMDQAMQLGGRQWDNKVESSIEFTSEAKDFSNGLANVQRTFGRITAKMTGMMKVDYDSNDEDSRPGPFAALADLVGESVTIALDDRGRVGKVTTSPDFPEKAAEMFGGDLQQWMAQSVPQLPDVPIGIGETWDNELELPMQQMGKVKLKIQNKLLEVTGKVAKFEQVIEFDAGSMKMPAGVEMKTEKSTGTTVVDLATGMPISSKMVMVMSIQGTPNGAPAAMNMLMSMTTSIERIEAPAKDAPKDAAKDAPKDGGK